MQKNTNRIDIDKYSKRLSIPIGFGSDNLNLYNEDEFLLCTGYERVVIGDRGPYVECAQKHIDVGKLIVPPEEQKRFDNPELFYYLEFRTNDNAFTKIYLQLKTVDYADYKVGMFYISPFDLYKKTRNGYEVLIEKPKR